MEIGADNPPSLTRSDRIRKGNDRGLEIARHTLAVTPKRTPAMKRVGHMLWHFRAWVEEGGLSQGMRERQVCGLTLSAKPVRRSRKLQGA